MIPSMIPSIGVPLGDSPRRRRWRMVTQLWAIVLTACLLLWMSLPQFAWSGSKQIVIPVQDQTYPQLVEQARPLVWEALHQQFAAQPEAQQITIEVMGERGEQRAPLMTVTMPRTDWQNQLPSSALDTYTRFYLNSSSLIQSVPVTPPPQSTSSTSSRSTTSTGELQLIATEPDDQQTFVAVDQPLRLEFNQPLPQALDALELAFEPQTDLGFAIDQQALILQPLQPLRYSTKYALHLPSLGSVALTSPVQVQFRTEPQYTYEHDIKPLLNASCVGCHQAAGRQARHRLDSYQALLTYVNPGDPDSEILNPRWLRRHGQILTATGPLNVGVPDPQSESGDSAETGSTPTSPSSDLVSGATQTGLVNSVSGAVASSSDGFTNLISLNSDADSAEEADPDPSAIEPRRGSPELAYIRRNGTPVTRLGHLTPAEAEILRTWIVQDQAVELNPAQK